MTSKNNATKAEQLLEKVREYAAYENLSIDTNSYEANDPRLVEAALELANKSKAILGGLYYDFRKTDNSFPRRLKNKLIGKIANIVRNTLERPLLTQQKYNEQSFYLINVLLAENAKLKQEIDQLKSQL